MEKIRFEEKEIDSINDFIDEIIQRRYSETVVIPTMTKLMLKNGILDYLKKENNKLITNGEN